VTEPVAWWLEQLEQRVGLGDRERGRMRARLLTFCALRGVSPAELLTTWEEHPELTARRRPGAAEHPEPAVESFLIHNGIDV
jgi:hypothetical protein